MSESDIALIEQISPSIASALRTADPNSAAYKAALQTVETPEFQTRLNALREASDYQTAPGVYDVDKLIEQNNKVFTEVGTDNTKSDNGSSFNWTLFGIIMGLLLLFMALMFVLMGAFAEAYMKKQKGVVLVCRCTKCNVTREELYENVMKGFSNLWTKYRSIDKSIAVGGFGVGTTYYSMYQKKIFCPTCNKKTWHEIENINELIYKKHPTMRKARDKMFEKHMKNENKS